MAENIVAGMFGLEPWQIQRSQQAESEAAAMRYGNQTDRERVNSNYYRAGAGLGHNLAGMMGMVTPEVQEANQKQSIMSQVDVSSPEGLKKGAAMFMQAGDQKTALQLVLAAQAMEKQWATTNHENAQASQSHAMADYYGNGGAKGDGLVQKASKLAIARQNAMKMGFEGGLKGQELYDFVESEVAKASQAWDAAYGNAPQSEEPSQPAPMLLSKPEVAGQVSNATEGKKYTEVMSGGVPVVAQNETVIGAVPAQFSPDNKGKISGAENTGKAAAESNAKQFDIAKKSNGELVQINKLITHLNTSDAITGIGADIFKGLNRAVALLGGKEAAKTASDTEILDVMMGSEVFPLIQSLGVGARGMDTPAEREYMRSVLTGSIPMNKASLLKMANLRKDAAEKNVIDFNKRVNKGELDSFFSQSGVTKDTLKMPARGKFDLSTPAKIKEVRTFINELSKTNPKEAEQILADFTAQLKRPKLTPEQAAKIAKERGLVE